MNVRPNDLATIRRAEVYVAECQRIAFPDGVPKIVRERLIINAASVVISKSAAKKAWRALCEARAAETAQDNTRDAEAGT